MSTKISDMTPATDLTGAVVPIVQGGVNKKADADLFGGSSLSGTIELTENLMVNGSYDVEFYTNSFRAGTDGETDWSEINISSDNLALSTSSGALINLYGGVSNDVLISSQGVNSSIIRLQENQIQIDTISLFLVNLPTDPTGLSVNQVWNDNGTLKIVLP